MTRYIHNYSLRDHNSFRVDASATAFFEFTETSDFQIFLKTKEFLRFRRKLILGSGSNLLFTENFEGLVICPNILGISIEKEDREQIFIRAGAGVCWDDFVAYAVANGWGGAENLSLIPGKVGAAPVQNIGAYGCEAAQIIESVKGIHLQSGDIYEVPAAKCNFGYRDSIFKNELKNQIVITSALFKLQKLSALQLSYKGLAEMLNLADATIETVRNAVISVRRSKLPDPEILGNAGSFFKNPVVPTEMAEKLKSQYNDMPVFDTPEKEMKKLPAAWLIDNLGWKGFRRGEAGVHENHALVLVNYGKATGREIFDLSEEIRASVFEKFSINLLREVIVVNNRFSMHKQLA
ncbi:MAG: UDP-N-acetylmuramate dehydrogenase [Prolixibacteraceae bacterium]|nr:UDP-N-acetylmuramate dehydrogenase [Prolixibacteraceae bacterium]